jgi:RNA polymerase sigma-70 factor (family 1)
LLQNQPYREKELLIRCVAGDEAAFKILFLHYWDRIHASILHICKQPEMAEDLAQEVFIRVWQCRHKLEEIERFDAFLYRVAKNLVLDEFRKKILPNLTNDYFDACISANGADVAGLLEEKELNHLLLKSVDKLPAQMQRVFTLHRFEGLTHQQIAEKLKISTVSSQTYMARAIVHLRKILAEYKGDIAIIALIVLKR